MKKFTTTATAETKRSNDQALKVPLMPREQNRAQPDEWIDMLFWRFAKAGAVPGIFFLFPPLLTSVFLCIGLIYHYGQLGAWISTGLSLGTLTFAYALRHFILKKNSFHIRRLGYIYLGSCLALITATTAFNIWGV